jgi:hypothetical protein
MKKILLTTAAIALFAFGMNSCKKGTAILAIDSQELYYDLDSVPQRGWSTLTKVAKYDVDEFCDKNNINDSWLQGMTFKDVELTIDQGLLKFSDYDSIAIDLWVTDEDTVKIVTKQVMDSTIFSADKKKATLRADSTFNAIDYVRKGDVYMKVKVHTAHDHVPSGRIHAVPHVDVLTDLKRKLNL